MIEYSSALADHSYVVYHVGTSTHLGFRQEASEVGLLFSRSM